ncbi:MAG TPA: amidase family protein, partial [Solirubrobacterales bacterium]
MGPDLADLQRIADDAGFGLEASELGAVGALIEQGGPPPAELLGAAPDAADAEGRGAARAAAGEAPLNAWAQRLEIPGAGSGPLAGRSLAVKDCIAVAGVPLGAGTSILRDFAPAADATVVRRALEAGAGVSGTASCEALTMSGGSHTGAAGPVRNPYDESRTPGGSSTGCAALLASGAVDLALGTDVAGSVRIPAAWSGLSALKPTYGLVPCTGIFPAAPSLDHVGPMARTVADAAVLLAAMADAPDPAPVVPRPGPRPLAGLRIAVTDRPARFEIEDDVLDGFAAAREACLALGAEVVDLPPG